MLTGKPTSIADILAVAKDAALDELEAGRRVAWLAPRLGGRLSVWGVLHCALRVPDGTWVVRQHDGYDDTWRALERPADTGLVRSESGELVIVKLPRRGATVYRFLTSEVRDMIAKALVVLDPAQIPANGWPRQRKVERAEKAAKKAAAPPPAAVSARQVSARVDAAIREGQRRYAFTRPLTDDHANLSLPLVLEAEEVTARRRAALFAGTIVRAADGDELEDAVAQQFADAVARQAEAHRTLRAAPTWRGPVAELERSPDEDD